MSRWYSAPERRRQTARGRWAACAAAALLISAGPGPAADPLPYRLTLAVGLGPSGGPESFRAEVAAELFLALSAAACFRALDPPPGSAGENDLVLQVTLDDYVDQTRYETTLGQRSATSDPEVARRAVAHASALVTLEVRTAGESAPLRHAHYRPNAEWRPLISEDPREIAMSQLVDEIVRRSRKFACGGSAKQWEKELRKARGR